MNQTDLIHLINQQTHFQLQVAPMQPTHLERDWYALMDLRQSAALGSAMSAYVQSYPGLDQRGQGAFFISHLSYLLASVLARFDLIAASLPTHFSANPLWIKPQTTPIQLRLESLSLEPATPAKLREVFIQCLQPFIAPIQELTRLSTSAQWRLVADAIAAAWLFEGRGLQLEAKAKAQALAILKDQPSCLNNRQTRFSQVSIWTPTQKNKAERPSQICKTYRLRGGCCRLYTAADHEHCATCVLLTEEQQHRRLTQLLADEQATQVA